MAEFHRVMPGPLETYAHGVIVAMGASEEIATETAHHLVRSNLSGHDSHGILRLPQYVAQADAGLLIPSAVPTAIGGIGATLLLDAGFGFGQYSTAFALDRAFALARQHGVSAVAVRHSTHIGRLGEYTERAGITGMIAIVTIGTAGPQSGRVVPFGGTEPFFGTNPWSYGVPVAGHEPMVYDAATSVVAEGKVRFAQSKGVPMPSESILDADGNPTTDPNKFYAGGALLPVGGAVAGHKGYGLAMSSALVAALAIIDDATPSNADTTLRPAGPRPRGKVAGVFLIAIDPAAFGDAAHYQAMTAETVEAVMQVPPAVGVREVLVPGIPEVRSRATRERDGILLPDATWRDLIVLAERFGVAMPEGKAE